MARKNNRRKKQMSRGMEGLLGFVLILFGMISVILGLLVYNEIISLNFFSELFQ